MKKSRYPLATKHLLLQPENEKDILKDKWTVSLNEGDRETIGSFTIEKTQVPGEMSIDVELDPEYRNKGYGTEVFHAMSRFALDLLDMKEICAACDHHNHPCINALGKAGFVLRDTKDGMKYFSVKKDKSSWTGLYMCIGFIAGLIIGIVISNLWIGSGIGLLAGLAAGILMDSKEKRDK